MTARVRAATPVGSCPDCLSWGSSYGSQSYCRACYDFTRRYGRGECAGCRRVIAVKKGHCRLCWLQAGIAAAGRRRLAPEDFEPPGYWQLSLTGMSRLGGTGPARQAPPDSPAPPGTAPGWTQLQLSAPGESLHFDKRHWTASSVTGPALEQARRIAANLAGARGWNDRVIAETSRALAVVLAGHQPGDMIAWSQLPPCAAGTSASPAPPRSSPSPDSCTTTGSRPSPPWRSRGSRCCRRRWPPASGTGCAPAPRAGPAAAPATSAPSG